MCDTSHSLESSRDYLRNRSSSGMSVCGYIEVN